MSDSLVFVYGTLKKGRGNYEHFLEGVQDVEFKGDHLTPSTYTMYSLGGFPGVREVGNTSIVGEVYQVPERVMDRLDGLEGYPSFYDRKMIPTPWGEAWIYLVNERYSNENIIQDGTW